MSFRLKYTSVLSLVFVFICFWFFRQNSQMKRWQHWSWKNISKMFEPNVGPETLPPEVQSMKEIVQSMNTKPSFNLASSIKENKWIYYSTIEALYPLRYDENSPLLFSYKNDPLGKGCKSLMQSQEITLYDCRN